jgi:hypothetical protein
MFFKEVSKMTLRDIYFLAFAMMAGVIIAYLLNLDMTRSKIEEFILGLGLQIIS